MSDPEKVPITNKHTGEVTSGQSAHSAMQRKDKKPGVSNDAESKKTESYGARTDPTAHQAYEELEPMDEAASEKKVPKKKIAKPVINSLVDFIDYAYSRKGQHLRNLAPGETKAIAKQAKLDELEFENLLNLSKSDSLLAVPRQIVFAVQKIDGRPSIWKEVRRFLFEVFIQHPIYRNNNLVPVIKNLPDAIEPDRAIETIADLSQENLKTLPGLEQLKPKDAEVLRLNAINNLSLWLWESRSLSVNKMIRWLYDGYWRLHAPKDANSIDCLQEVTSITEISGIGTACQQFKSAADTSERKVIELKIKIRDLQGEIERQNSSVKNLQASVQERDQTISALTQELEHECSAHADSRVHLSDDREQMRSNMVRYLKREVSLLAEGLQALRKDPPKVRVMDDHAERALEGLQAAIKKLEAED